MSMALINKTCERCKSDFQTELEDVVWCSEACKNKMHINYCRKCDKRFYTYQKNKAYCSEKCRLKRCIVCNKVFLPKNSETYCSEECKVEKYTHKCIVCDKKFFKHVPSAKFCSSECRNIIQTAKKKYKLCKNCGKVIIIFNENTDLYCNRECYNEYLNKVKAGKLKNLNKDEKNILLEESVKSKVEILISRMLDPTILYTFNAKDMNAENGFTEAIKEAVKERDNYCCYICEGLDSLDIHHIVKQRHGGSHNKENLVTLCRKCHRHIETGNKEYAIKKCLQNAKKNAGIFELKLKEKINKTHALSMVKLELEEALDLLIEKEDFELKEIIYRVNEILDQLEEI